MGSFADQVAGFAERAKKRELAVFRHAVVLLARELTRTRANGGSLPHKTGNLMRSLLAEVGSMPLQGKGGEKYAGANVGAVVASALLTSDIYLGYQAAYARRMNYGFVGEDSLGRTYNQAGNGFVERAVAMWPDIVKQAIHETENGVGV